jgi:hypothetical protein
MASRIGQRRGGGRGGAAGLRSSISASRPAALRKRWMRRPARRQQTAYRRDIFRRRYRVSIDRRSGLDDAREVGEQPVVGRREIVEVNVGRRPASAARALASRAISIRSAGARASSFPDLLEARGGGVEIVHLNLQIGEKGLYLGRLQRTTVRGSNFPDASLKPASVPGRAAG